MSASPRCLRPAHCLLIPCDASGSKAAPLCTCSAYSLLIMEAMGIPWSGEWLAGHSAVGSPLQPGLSWASCPSHSREDGEALKGGRQDPGSPLRWVKVSDAGASRATHWAELRENPQRSLLERQRARHPGSTHSRGGDLWTPEGCTTPRSLPAAPRRVESSPFKEKTPPIWPGLELCSLESPHLPARGAHRHDCLLNISPKTDSF